jgi:hypothetical protein
MTKVWVSFNSFCTFAGKSNTETRGKTRGRGVYRRKEVRAVDQSCQICLKSLRGYYTSEASSMAPGVDGDEFPDEIESRLVGIFGCTNQSYQGIGLSFKIEQKRIRVS